MGVVREPPACVNNCGYTLVCTVVRYGHVDVGAAASRRGNLVEPHPRSSAERVDDETAE